MHRFYAPGSWESGQVTLSGDEAAHLIRVLRLKRGDRIEIFDGEGGVATAEIAEILKRDAILQVRDSRPGRPAAVPHVTLITAMPKAERFRWLVEKATELGVSRLIPVRTERSVVHPGDGKLQKMEAAAIAACKQCGRNDLPGVAQLTGWEDALSSAPADALFIAHPGGEPVAQLMEAASRVSHLTLAIGPEGGFSPAELVFAGERGGRLISLGPNILRIETAALVMLTCALLVTPPLQT